MKKRLMYRCVVFTLLLVFVCSVPAHAETANIPAPVRSELTTVSNDFLPYDSERLFTGYANRVFGKQLLTAFKTNRRSLNDVEKYIYDALLAAASQIADGKLDDSEITVELNGSPLKTDWTEAELGISFDEVDDYDILSLMLSDGGALTLQFDVLRVLSAVMSDNPFDFYWVASNAPLRFGYYAYIDNGQTADGTRCKLVEPTIVFDFPVDRDYRPEGCTLDDHSVDTEATGRCKTAVDNAAAIIAEAADMSDTARLTYYMQRIRALSDYYMEVYEPGFDFSENSGPWQLIYVFDGDPDTKVVCEGYSKAFQYLCDNSTFRDKTIDVYSVSGYMNGESHMWNTVHRYTGNYLVDVTNCIDTGATTDSLFLSTPCSGDPDNGYVMKVSPEGYDASYFTYQYIGPEYGQHYSREQMTLSTVPFAEPEYVQAELDTVTGDALCLYDDRLGYSSILYFYDSAPTVTLEGRAVRYDGTACTLRALANGDARLILTGAKQQLELTIHVGDVNTFVLPAGTKTVSAEAFKCTEVKRFVLDQALTEIDAHAFDGLTEHMQFVIPAGLNAEVLAGIPGGNNILWLCGDTDIAVYAVERGYPYILTAQTVEY